MIVKYLILLLIIASWVYWLVAWRLTVAFFQRPRARRAEFYPSISVLKPVKSIDTGAYENFVSFCQQDYPAPVEILFGVADGKDPAAHLVRRLQQAFPDKNIRLIVGATAAKNPKVAILARLAIEATGEVLVLSDADIRVCPDFLGGITAPLHDRTIGLVTCPYRGLAPESFAARLANLHMDATFLPSVIVASELFNTRIGLGAAMALRRAELDRIGGFASIGDFLADDFQLAARIGDLGLQIKLSDYVVSSVLGRVRLGDQWNREIRWSRGIRVSCPWRYPGLLLTFSTPLAVLSLCFPGAFVPGLVAVAASIALRWTIASRIAKSAGGDLSKRTLLLLPPRDTLSAIIWCVSAVGRRVIWRGQRFNVVSGGRLMLLDAKSSFFSTLIRRLVRRLDLTLRKSQGIYEYSQSADCALRISVGQSGENVELSDGTHIAFDDAVAHLHLWNEHMLAISESGPDLSWAVHWRQQLTHSLEELAMHARTDPRYARVRAFHAEASAIGLQGIRQIERFSRHFGFEMIPHQPRSAFSRLHDRGEDFLIWLLSWTFNPRSVKVRIGSRRERCDCWISKRAFLDRYAGMAVRITPGRAAVTRAEPVSEMIKS